MKFIIKIFLLSIIVVSLTGCGNSAQKHLDKGLIYLDRNNPEGAIAEFQMAVEKDPNLVQAHYELGRAYTLRSIVKVNENKIGEAENLLQEKALKSLEKATELKGRIYWKEARKEKSERKVKQGLKEAEQEFQKALRENPNYTVAHNSLAKLYLAMNKPKKAAEEFKMAPNSVEAHQNRALSLIRGKKVKEALEELQKAAEIDPYNPTVHGALGSIYAGGLRFDEAINEFTKELKINSQSLSALIGLGQIYAQLGKRDKAISNFEKASDIDSNNLMTMLKLGDLYMREGRYDEAMTKANSILSMDPEDKGIVAQANHILGHAYAQKGEFEEAVKKFEEVVKIKDDFAPGHFNLGLAYSSKGDFDKALAELQRTLELEPKQVGALLNLAIVYQQKVDYVNAIAKCEEALNLEPKNSLAYTILSNIYIAQKKYDKATEQAKSIIENAELHQARLQLIESFRSGGIDPRGPMIHSNLAIMYLFQNWHDQTIKECEDVLMENPNNLIAYNTLVTAYDRQKDFDNAVTNLKKMIELEPNFSLPYIRLGKLYNKQERYDEAVPMLKKALEIKPESFEAQFSLGLVYEMMGNREESIKSYKKSLTQLQQSSPQAAVINNQLAWLYAESGKKEDLDAALSLAKKANEINPRSGDIIDTLPTLSKKSTMKRLTSSNSQ